MFSQIIKILLVLTIALMEVKGRPKCEMSDKTADDCGKKLMYIGETDAKLPKSDQDMVNHCGNINEGLQCLKKYTKTCGDPFASQMMNIVLKNGDKMEDKYCKQESGRKKLLDAFLCVEHTDEQINELHLCMEKFVVQMEHLNKVNGDHRIPATCCSYHVLDACTKTSIGKMCGDKTKVDYISKFLNEMTSEVITQGCGKYSSISACDKSMDKNEWQMLKDLVTSDDLKEIRSKRINSSPFKALTNILHQIIDE